ncbi:2591_t:CDS:2, partial [Dentiscutata heterogama]
KASSMTFSKTQHQIIMQFIQRHQHKPNKLNSGIDWIPYNDLKNIQVLEKGGFSTIFTAVWVTGPITKWESSDSPIIRMKNYKVALKYMDKNLFTKFMRDYYEEGNLRQYLNANFDTLSWYNKVKILQDIDYGLKTIHGNSKIHGDLHSGNILIRRTAAIADFGLCKSKYECENNQNEAYGEAKRLGFVAASKLWRELSCADRYYYNTLASNVTSLLRVDFECEKIAVDHNYQDGMENS